jgi:Ca-activated chloride channel family protein
MSVSILSFALASMAYADGIIIPEPPICEFGPCPGPMPISQLSIEYHRVRVTIEDQVAIIHVDQVFRNDNDWVVEGTYIFPLPKDASVDQFTLWIDGEPVEGKILTKEEARRIYEEIVYSFRDPALLEYLDQGAVQASVFPIEPGSTRRIELEYTQILPAENGLIQFKYPLNTEKFSAVPLEEVSIVVEIDSKNPLKAIYSPTHSVAIDRRGDGRAIISYEANDVLPDKDFDLFFSVAQADIGLNLLSYRDPWGGDGFFLLMASPGFESDIDRAIPKDVLLILDQSGSMEGEKFRQAQDALKFVLEHLNPQDRFNIIAFSTGSQSFASGLRGSEQASEAIRWVDSLSARGSTDINRALLEGVLQLSRERTSVMIFLTDGLPTEGVVNTDMILGNIQDAAPSNLRLFAFGVGFDVDTFLLDSLAKNHHGTTTYVMPGQAIDEIVSGFYAKVNSPVLTNIELDFGQVIAYDMYPDPLPDLFSGSQLILVGRYRDPEFSPIRLTGEVQGETRTFIYEDLRFRQSGGNEFLPRLWATRKIGSLLKEIRLSGPEQELVDQIVQLSIRYGIVTPYTSYLVTEPGALSLDVQQELSRQVFSDLAAAPTEVTGQSAVERAAGESMLAEADVPVSPSEEFEGLVKVIGSKAFRNLQGVWIDTSVDPETADTVKVPFLSDDYFDLAGANGQLGDALALGQFVIVNFDGVVYEIVDAEASGDEFILPEPDLGDETEVVDIRPASDERSINIPCFGSIGLIGLVAVPGLLRRKTISL